MTKYVIIIFCGEIRNYFVGNTTYMWLTMGFVIQSHMQKNQKGNVNFNQKKVKRIKHYSPKNKKSNIDKNKK